MVLDPHLVASHSATKWGESFKEKLRWGASNRTKFRVLNSNEHPLENNSELEVTDLTAGEMFIIWGVRHWIGCVLNQISPDPFLRQGCRNVRMEELASSISNLMEYIIPNSVDMKWASCMEYKHLVTGEKNILRCIYLMQHEDLSEISRFSKTWLQPSICSLSSECFSEIAETLSSQNHIFPLREFDYDTYNITPITSVSIH